MPDWSQIVFSMDLAHALVAYLIREYKRVSRKKLGRTILQKLCYFAKAAGVPIPFRFDIYHYGPFSQEVFETVDDLILDGVIADESPDRSQSSYTTGVNCDLLLRTFQGELDSYKRQLENVAETFSLLDPSSMELVSTIHYIHASWFTGVPRKEEVVNAVWEIKRPKSERE